jgi:hypothetical protein
MQALSSNTISQQDRHSLHPGLAPSHYDNASLANSSPCSPTPLHSTPHSFQQESNAPRVRCCANEGGRGAAGVVADIAKLSVGREEYYTCELATDHQQYLSGHGESPGRWYGAGASSLGLQGEASPRGFAVRPVREAQPLMGPPRG